jgi:hypothetical protein
VTLSGPIDGRFSIVLPAQNAGNASDSCVANQSKEDRHEAFKRVKKIEVSFHEKAGGRGGEVSLPFRDARGKSDSGWCLFESPVGQGASDLVLALSIERAGLIIGFMSPV